MKKNILLPILMAFLLVSCSKDEEVEKEAAIEKETVQNQITFENQGYDANFAMHVKYPSRFELILSDVNILQDTTYTGKMNFVSMAIYSENGVIVPGTYTFSLDTVAAYDPSKHFFDSHAGIEMDVVNGAPDTSTIIENTVSGTVTISENNNIYDIEYSIEYEEGTIEASYTGNLFEILNEAKPVVEETMIGKWQLSSIVVTTEGQEMTEPLTDCDKKTTIEFGENGIFTNEGFSEQNGECFSAGTTSAVWEDKGNDVITIIHDSGSSFDYTITVSGDSTLSVYYAGDESGGAEQTSTWTRIN